MSKHTPIFKVGPFFVFTKFGCVRHIAEDGKEYPRVFVSPSVADVENAEKDSIFAGPYWEAIKKRFILGMKRCVYDSTIEDAIQDYQRGR